MPRKCCVPSCKGNYSSGPKVSVFLFPKNDELRLKWTKSIHRDDFLPTNQSVVCELHFPSSEIERESSVYDPKSGKLITAPLDRPRLKKDAVPSLFPGCATYLSKSSVSREGPEEKRVRLENSFLEAAIRDSLSSHTEYVNKNSFSSLDEMVSAMELNCDWVLLRKDDHVLFLFISEYPHPSVVFSVCVKSDLFLTVHMRNIELKKVGTTKLPIYVNDKNTLLSILDEVGQMFKNSSKGFTTNVDDKLDLVQLMLNDLCSSLPEKEDSIRFLVEQVSLLNCNKYRMKYSWESIVYWSLVNSISPHCYKYLRSNSGLMLPSQSTLSKICNNFSASPIDEQGSEFFLCYLSKKVTCLREEDKNVVLLVDEVHVKPQLDYKGGNIVGQGEGSSQCANSAFVFMVRSINSDYLDVAHILPVKTISAEKLFPIMRNIIVKLEVLGFKVLGIVTDNSSVNRKCVSLFSNPPEIKVKYTHPCCQGSERHLYFIFDSVHILKCIRNNWLNVANQKIKFKCLNEGVDKVASFHALKTLHKLEKDKLLKYGQNLTLKSLYPTSIERQNVKLALNVFCHGTVVALRELGRQKNIENWEGTANFIEIICTWWDIVNVKTVFKGQRYRNRYQEPITRHSEHIVEFMSRFSNWVSKEVVGLSKETQFASRHTSVALLDMASYCINSMEKNYFLAGKIQTDCLESRFGQYRQMCGGNYHISVRQIFETESKLRIQSCLSQVLKSKKAGTISLTISDIFDNDREANEGDSEISNSQEFSAFRHIAIDEDDIDQVVENVFPVICYISGYCSYKIVKKQCGYCKVFVCADDDELFDTRNSLIHQTDRGGLCYPSTDVITTVSYVVGVTQEVLMCNEELFLQQPSQRKLLMHLSLENLPNSVFSNFQCTLGHSSKYIISSIVKTSVNILLNNYIKKVNDNTTKKSVTLYKRSRKS